MLAAHYKAARVLDFRLYSTLLRRKGAMMPNFIIGAGGYAREGDCLIEVM
jgi:hypothetical protein